MNDHEQRFGGIGRLYGQKAFGLLKNAKVAVIGIGGVGSWTAEALVRTGLTDITLIDLDEVCISNTNRQIHALDGNIGKSKAEAMKERMQLINPSVKVTTIVDFFTQSTADEILSLDFDIMIDAIDSVDNKCLLIAECIRRQKALVTCGSVGGRIDPTQIRKADLNSTTNDTLLRNVRKKLRKNHSIPAEGPLGVPAVFSLEIPVFPNAFGEVCAVREKGVNSRMDCSTGFGTATQVAGSLGFAAAAAAIELFLRNHDYVHPTAKDARGELKTQMDGRALSPE
ncbi:MAG: tRNA threonylcarbamoyladenosine dehydratase [Proteobacteria bacterium]|nr:MAG: tRNA threonylcarbamoyladenosine dehydratase [Pseudomonadota bacterium]